MMKYLTRLSQFVVVLAAAAPWVPAAACGLESGLGDSWSAAHSGSLNVAFATRDAIASGVLVPDPALEPTPAHKRADERVQMLAAAVLENKSATPVAVLLIESGVWTRLTPKGTWVVTEHVDSPQTSDATLITSELALRELISGRLSAGEALQRGVLALSAESCCRETLLAALRLMYPAKVSTAALR